MNPSRQNDEEILRLYASGLLIKEIAARVGKAPNTVGQALKRLGVERPGKPQKKRRDYSEDVITDLWDGGLSVSAIAERFALSSHFVASVIKSSGRQLDRRIRYDGEGGTIAKGGGHYRIARRA